MSVNSFETLKKRIKHLNESIEVNIKQISLNECKDWSYNEESGMISHKSGAFFSITGIKSCTGEKLLVEQPIIIQDEIGFLGIIRKRINGEMHYLMQYKIEPGNINNIQISPTIQATKSNFSQKHGGKKPKYLDYFINSHKYKIIADQIQSEQSSRFIGKRNRNMIIELSDTDEIELSESHDWFTMDQLKKMMRYNNLVNMDTRTVISCLPVYDLTIDELESRFSVPEFINSINNGTPQKTIPGLYNYINDHKMFNDTNIQKVPLFSLENWRMKDDEFVCEHPYSFRLIFCDIEIEGREVRKWCQPLFKAEGVALFGLIICNEGEMTHFLVRCKSEIGCFDKIEIGPTVQREYISSEPITKVDILFNDLLNKKKNIIFDTLLSEEGGRFYHEQNRNVIIETDKLEDELPEGYFWCDYKTLNYLVQINNTLNIQLRNLLSVLEC